MAPARGVLTGGSSAGPDCAIFAILFVYTSAIAGPFVPCRTEFE
jgi:hypothetical protein